MKPFVITLDLKNRVSFRYSLVVMYLLLLPIHSIHCVEVTVIENLGCCKEKRFIIDHETLDSSEVLLPTQFVFILNLI